jgi:hypothetical protein
VKTSPALERNIIDAFEWTRANHRYVIGEHFGFRRYTSGLSELATLCRLFGHLCNYLSISVLRGGTNPAATSNDRSCSKSFPTVNSNEPGAFLRPGHKSGPENRGDWRSKCAKPLTSGIGGRPQLEGGASLVLPATFGQPQEIAES